MVKDEKKRTLGRQKIEIKRINKEDARQVCFSKRRMGLFKKAHELSVLCGAEIALLVFSPAGKPFSYGHPSVEHVVKRFKSGVPGGNTVSHNLDPCYNDVVASLHKEHEDLLKQVEQQQKLRTNAEELVRRQKENEPWQLWNRPINDLKLEELEIYKTLLLDLSAKLADRSNQLMYEAALFNNCGNVAATAEGNLLVPFDGYDDNGNNLLAFDHQRFGDMKPCCGKDGLLPLDAQVAGDNISVDTSGAVDSSGIHVWAWY